MYFPAFHLHQNKVLTLTRNLFLPRFLVCCQVGLFDPCVISFSKPQISLSPFNIPWSSPNQSIKWHHSAVTSCVRASWFQHTYQCVFKKKSWIFSICSVLLKKQRDGNKMDLGYPAWIAVFLLTNSQVVGPDLGCTCMYNEVLPLARGFCLARKAVTVTKEVLRACQLLSDSGLSCRSRSPAHLEAE